MPCSTLLSCCHSNCVEHPASGYLIGFSGGMDSHVLLDVLCQLRDSGQLTTPIAAIHINHNLQPVSPNWVKHCQSICQDYQIPLIIETVLDKPQRGESIEAFAREKRYALIEKHLKPDTIFLSAHHQRDQAETFLLQLMRGAGLDGLRAMPVIKNFGVGQYLRPLLTVDYDDMVDYARTQQLNFIDDDSNTDRRFDRNFLRHEVLPVLEKRFPHANRSIAQSAKWLSEVSVADSPVELSIDVLASLTPVQQKQQIRKWMKSKTGISLSKNQTQYVLQHHLNAQLDKHPALIIGDYVIRRYAGELCLSLLLPEFVAHKEQSIMVGQSVEISSITTLVWEAGHGLLTDKALTVKSLVGNQRFHPHTRAQASTVKKCLNEAQVPVWLRLFYVGIYIDNELVAIPGVGVAVEYYQKHKDAQLPVLDIDSQYIKI